jgi:hypothetical protein
MDALIRSVFSAKYRRRAVSGPGRDQLGADRLSDRLSDCGNYCDPLVGLADTGLLNTLAFYRVSRGLYRDQHAGRARLGHSQHSRLCKRRPAQFYAPPNAIRPFSATRRGCRVHAGRPGLSSRKYRSTWTLLRKRRRGWKGKVSTDIALSSSLDKGAYAHTY